MKKICWAHLGGKASEYPRFTPLPVSGGAEHSSTY